MGDTFRSVVTDGPLLVAAGVAALVGLISFASPCVLPLVPGYLSYVAGLVGTGTPVAAGNRGVAGGTDGATATAVRVDERSPRTRMVLGAVLFVLGFTAVFVTVGTGFGDVAVHHDDLGTQRTEAVELGPGLPDGSAPAGQHDPTSAALGQHS